MSLSAKEPETGQVRIVAATEVAFALSLSEAALRRSPGDIAPGCDEVS